MYDWKGPKQGNPEEYQVIRVTKDLQVFRNGELEGKIRMFRNGNFSYFGYTLQSVDEAEAKVVWNPPPSKKKKDAPAKGPVRTSKLASNISYLLSGLLISLPWEVPFQMHRSCGGKNEPLIYSRLFLLKGPRAERPYHSVFMTQPSEGQCVDSACQRCTVESQRKILAFKIPLGVDA